MITRLEPVIIELMRQKEPVLIVSHQATLRVLYAYLTDKPPEACPDILFPLHTIIQLTPKAYGCEEVRDGGALHWTGISCMVAEGYAFMYLPLTTASSFYATCVSQVRHELM